jgi:hypothetical protein
LRGPRQALHGRIAAAIEVFAPELTERELEILAHDLVEASEAERVAMYWRKAGELAVRRAANREAIGNFRRALSLIEQQAEGPKWRRAKLAPLSRLAPPLMAVYGLAAPEAGFPANARRRSVCVRPGMARHRGAAGTVSSRFPTAEPGCSISSPRHEPAQGCSGGAAMRART